MVYLTENFTDDELACPCCSKCEMNVQFLKMLQDVRSELARPFYITSGYRCSKHNEKVGGSPMSKHQFGMAVDISTEGWSGEHLHMLMQKVTSYQDVNPFEKRFDIVKLQNKNKSSTGIGIYKAHVHIDLRFTGNAAWVKL